MRSPAWLSRRCGVSVGASGAICGVLGALLAFLVVHRRAIPPTVLRQLRRNVLGVVVVMALLGAVVPNIDQAAHLGGLAVGFASGLLLIGPWPVVPGRRRRLLARRLALGGAIAVALAGAAVVVARRGDAAIPADRRLDDFTEQITPIVREFDAIRRDLARAIGRLDRGEDPPDLHATIPVVRDLRSRAQANWRRLGGVRAFGRELWAIQGSLDSRPGRAVPVARCPGRWLRDERSSVPRGRPAGPCGDGPGAQGLLPDTTPLHRAARPAAGSRSAGNRSLIAEARQPAPVNCGSAPSRVIVVPRLDRGPAMRPGRVRTRARGASRAAGGR